MANKPAKSSPASVVGCAKQENAEFVVPGGGRSAARPGAGQRGAVPLTVPNLLCLVRLALAPVLLLVAWQNLPLLFLGLLAAALLSDAADGFIARRLDQTTELGSKLDSWADVSVYLSLPLACWWLWPEVIRREFVYVAVIVFSLLLPGALAWLKFGTAPSYHTWLVKAAAVVTSCATVLMVLGGPAWPFRLAALLCLLAALEQALITRLLERPRSDVGTLWHVLSARASSRRGDQR